MGLYGVHWGRMGLYGAVWGFIGPCGAVWGFIGPYGAVWGPLGLYGVHWGHIGRCGAVWGGVGRRCTHGGKQCAALSSHRGAMSAPPQTWRPWKETLLCHGHCPERDAEPPTMRLSIGVPHGTAGGTAGMGGLRDNRVHRDPIESPHRPHREHIESP